jgi:PhoPQ-activated pathogenicity-related protein
VPEVDRSLWQHWLVIVKPDKVRHDTAYLRIGSGRNGSEAPEKSSAQSVEFARGSGTVVAELGMVPNQPLVFNNDGKQRNEDDLIAYCHIKFMDTGDATWLPRLPMVKSAVRAMDAVTAFLASEAGGKTAVKKFVVAGGSKRGWTTWCTAAVDKRVEAAIPIVIDVLNVNQSMTHHVQAYGFYSAAVGDYHEHELMQRRDHPRLRDLYAIEDPFSYRDRLTMPKYIVNASGDEFFCPDSSQFYWNELQGEKNLRYVPNASHGLKGSDAGDGIIAFYHMILAGKPRPTYSWTFEKDGSIRVTAKEKPREVRLWQGTNPDARDFRLLKVGKIYSSTPIAAGADGSYVGRIEAPVKGWTAFYVELDFDSGCKYPLKLSTAVRVLPDVLPHAGIDPAKAPLEKIPGRSR